MLFFERVEPNATQYGLELDSLPGHNVFQTPAWLSFLAATQAGEPVAAILRDGNRVLGRFSGMVIQRCGLRILGSPFPGWTTSYMGLNLAPGVSVRDAMQALAKFAFRDLRCIHLELMSRHLNAKEMTDLGWESRWYRGFEIDLTRSEEELLKAMAPACRRCIRKAIKFGITIEQANDEGFAGDYYTQLRDVFAKQNLAPTYGIERIRALLTHIGPTGMGLFLRARNDAGRCIATGIFVGYGESMYLWGAASFREFQILRPNELVIWHAMRYWKERGVHYFDMGGGGEYKRKYGGQEIAVPWVRVSKFGIIPHLRDTAQAVIRFRQMLRGRIPAITGKPSAQPDATADQHGGSAAQ